MSRETCGYCGGTGKRTPTENFLLARLRAHHDYRWIGLSSTALVLAAIDGRDEALPKPMDGWDLGRCLVTERVAPPELKVKMKPLVERWMAEMEERKSATDLPYWGPDAARKMLSDHGSDVNDLVGLVS